MVHVNYVCTGEIYIHTPIHLYIYLYIYEQYIYCSFNLLTARKVRRICMMRLSKAKNEELIRNRCVIVEYSTSNMCLDIS